VVEKVLLSPPFPTPSLTPPRFTSSNPSQTPTLADAREKTVTGTLKGYDALMNLVLDDVSEVLRDDEGNTSSRALGLVVARGTLLVLVSPCDGSEEIANPFVQGEE
jgi:small nuclear ribonucleoprotein (snRNP)-like protein